jgi:hypothetical protein
MSEHPDWRQFKLEEEHNTYLSDLATELDIEGMEREGVNG